MLYPSEDGRHPSLVVEDGETVTISAGSAREMGIPTVAMRPRTTSALLVLGGQPPPRAPRLSDRGAFEETERADGLINLSELDEEGRIAGYSVPFIRGVLEALDPEERVPPRSVKRLVPVDEEDEDCGCSSHRPLMRQAGDASGSPARHAATHAEASLSPTATHSVRESYVPGFLAGLEVFSIFTLFGDIVVGQNATLVLDSDVSFAIADNFLAYTGSRIVQRASYLNVDVTATMRGGVSKVVHHVGGDVLRVHWDELAAQPFTKP